MEAAGRNIALMFVVNRGKRLKLTAAHKQAREPLFASAASVLHTVDREGTMLA